ncbi:chaplin [Streptomyces noursei]|uniref:chaplin n=1 Tax=Streptomyces noursei TaxID=1971 RepID=UPI0033C37238
MRKGLRTCLLVAAASGVLGAGVGPVFADAGAPGGAVDAPGVLSGNAVRMEVNAPADVCGDSVLVVGLLSPDTGNRCGTGTVPGPVLRQAPAGGPRPEGHRGRPVRRSVPRGDHDRRVGAVARAGKSAGEALLASTGTERLGLAAGAGGGLLATGAVLLRRARRRRG